MTTGIARRLAALEARLPSVRPSGPTLDLGRLDPDECQWLNGVVDRVGCDAMGRLALQALTDDELERVDALIRKVWEDAVE